MAADLGVIHTVLVSHAECRSGKVTEAAFTQLLEGGLGGQAVWLWKEDMYEVVRLKSTVQWRLQRFQIPAVENVS